MVTDVFGDLREWDRVIGQLDDLAAAQSLDEHQQGVARILRYEPNSRLRERALRCCSAVINARDVLIAEVNNLLADQSAPLELRIAAAEALGHLVAHRCDQPESKFDVNAVVQTMEHLRNRPGPPRLLEALDKALSQSGNGPECKEPTTTTGKDAS